MFVTAEKDLSFTAMQWHVGSSLYRPIIPSNGNRTGKLSVWVVG